MKRLVILLLLVVVVAAGAGLFLLLYEEEHVPPAALSDLENPQVRAINAALAYLTNREEDRAPSWQVCAVLDFLRRRFDLGPQYAFSRTYGRQTLDYDQAEVELLGRMVNPKYVVARQVIEAAADTRIMHVMGQAMYCDRYPLPEAYVEELLEALYTPGYHEGLPGYMKSHIALCFQWMRELGCDADFPELAAQWDRVAEELVALVEQGGAATDLAFEAMAFLYYIGHGERVRSEWLEALPVLQAADGAWAYHPGGPGDSHPTVLALWALLEHTLQDTEKAAWLK